VLASGSGESFEYQPLPSLGDDRMNAVKYDLIVVGSGPSGQRAAVAASKLKKKVAIVEARSVVGGVCINTGTIPSKTMREAVLHLSGYNYRTVYGMNYRVKEKITMADLAFRVQGVVKTEIDVTEAQLSRNGIDTRRRPRDSGGGH
jgi:NAD(P) transhydrogenase